MSLNKVNLFSTPIWQTKILDDNYNNILKKTILEKVKKNLSVKKTNFGGWQSESILKEQTFYYLMDIIKETIKNTELNPKNIHFKQGWCNVNYKYNWNVIHNHGQHHLSAVYFVQKPKDSGNLALRDPRAILTAGWGSWTDNFYKINNEDAIMYLNSIDKDLIIFPSFLDHFVTPSNSEKERITVAFDILCN
tara:strand:+ start:754 stop:1329 length:576 start_codon:yes stop_codon:yes gene_type:complete